MKTILRALGYEARFYRERRGRLSKRLRWVFFIDYVEGTLDSMIRRQSR